jgi:ATP-dependent Clp protease ATP-binding subunit ClpC
MIAAPRGTRLEFDALSAETEGLLQSLASPQWETMKQQLTDEMGKPEFWQRPDRHVALSRLALIDRVAEAGKTAESLRGRVARARSGRTTYSREPLSRLALQLYVTREGVKDVFEDAPVEVALMVEPALDTPLGDKQATAAWCRQVLAMYRGWSEHRHMQLEELPGETPDLPVLLISGFGTHRVLSRECGLHVLELAEGGAANRAIARVRLAVSPLGDLPQARLAAALAAAFDKAPRSSDVVRRYRGEPAPLVRNADGSWRTGRIDAVLRGDFDLMAQP